MNKFNAIRTNGMASKLEASVYQILKLKEKAGLIDNIEQQVGIDLGCGIRWKVDFAYYDKTEKQVVYCEAKGLKTEGYRLKLKLWEGGNGPGKLLVYEGHYQSPRLVRVINPKTKEK